MALRFRYWNSSAESATVQTVYNFEVARKTISNALNNCWEVQVLTPIDYREALLRSFKFTSYLLVANDCLEIFRTDKEKKVQRLFPVGETDPLSLPGEI